MMNWHYLSWLVAGILTLIALGLFKIARWHLKEAHFWRTVEVLVSVDPAMDRVYRPLLDWAKENQPSDWARLLPWHSPSVRRARANRH